MGAPSHCVGEMDGGGFCRDGYFDEGAVWFLGHGETCPGSLSENAEPGLLTGLEFISKTRSDVFIFVTSFHQALKTYNGSPFQGCSFKVLRPQRDNLDFGRCVFAHIIKLVENSSGCCRRNLLTGVEGVGGFCLPGICCLAFLL